MYARKQLFKGYMQLNSKRVVFKTRFNIKSMLFLTVQFTNEFF